MTWHASSGRSTPRRSAVPSWRPPAATAASAPGCTARPRSRCCTRCSTPTGTVATARATSASCGSRASTRRARANGMTYNRLIQGLRLAGVEVDRKILADLAVNDAAAFAAIVESPGPPSRPRAPAAPRPGRLIARRRGVCRSTAGAPRPGADPCFTPRYAPGRRRPAAAAPPRPRRRPAGSSPRARRRSGRRWPPASVAELFGTPDGAAAGTPTWSTRPAPGAGLAGDRRGLAALAETVTPQGVVAVCRHLRRAAGRGAGRRGRGWSRCSPGSATRATPARCCAPPTRPARARWSSPATRSTRTTASACGPAPAACSTSTWSAAADPAGGRRRCARAGLHGARRRPATATTTSTTCADAGAAGRPTAWLFGSEAHGLPAGAGRGRRRPGPGADPRARGEPQPGCGRGGLPVRFGQSTALTPSGGTLAQELVHERVHGVRLSSPPVGGRRG